MSRTLQNCMDLPPISRQEWKKAWRYERYRTVRFMTLSLLVIIGPITYGIVMGGAYLLGSFLILIANVITLIVIEASRTCGGPYKLTEYYDRYVRDYHAGHVDRAGRDIYSGDRNN